MNVLYICHVTALYYLVQAFSSMQELLCKAPMIMSTAGLSRSEIHLRWSEWKKEVNQRREGGEFIAVPQLQLLAKVCRGGERREEGV